MGLRRACRRDLVRKVPRTAGCPRAAASSATRSALRPAMGDAISPGILRMGKDSFASGAVAPFMR